MKQPNRVLQLSQLKHMQATFCDNEDPYEELVVTDPDPDINQGIQHLIAAFDDLITIIQEKTYGQKETRQVRHSAARRIS